MVAKGLMSNNIEEFGADEVFERECLFSLIRSARTGDQKAFLTLKDKYKPLLSALVTKYSLLDMPQQDIEDLKQEALVIFYNALCNYECSSDGVEFGLYAKICIENGLVSFIRSYLRRAKRAVLPLENADDRFEDGIHDPLQSLVAKENMSDMVRMIRKHLSEYENHVWWLYVSGMSVSDIAKELGGVDPKSVSNAVYRIRKKLRSVIADHNKF
jgi:RNA polymerase sigma factor (sigma-70 family)